MSMAQLSEQALRDHPLIHRYFPQGIDPALLAQQLRDPRLTALDLDDLAEMSQEELGTLVFTHSLAQRDRLFGDRPDLPAERDGPVEAGPDEPPSPVSVHIEGIGATAKIVLHRPAPGQPAPDLAVLQHALAGCGVTDGILQDYLERLAERPVYERRFKIAQGALPVDGEDGRVQFYFDTSAALLPAIDEAGIADYKALNYAKSVKAGEVLCDIFAPTPGQDGKSVLGGVLPACPGKAVQIRCGSNTVEKVLDDRIQIVAACDGQVRLRNDKIFVSRVLMVDAVDASTGNILFVGTVQVRGDVAAGFTVRAGGDIVVQGVAEAATLVAGGNLLLCNGMQGGETGRAEAGGNVRAQFIENAYVRAAQNIYADMLLNCTVECGEEVHLMGKNGRLVGGRCVAGRLIKAAQIGNDANTPTALCLQEMEGLLRLRGDLQTRQARYHALAERLNTVLHIAADGADIQGAGFQILLIRVAITGERLRAALEQLDRQLKSSEAGYISRSVTAAEVLFPNTTIEIDGVGYKNMQSRPPCVVQRLQEQLVFRALRQGT